MNSAEFLDAVRAKHGLTSDYQVAKRFGIPLSSISHYRTGRRGFDDATSIKIAAALDEQPLYVIASVNAERAKCSEVKGVWEYCARIGKQATTAALLALAVFLAIDAPALENAGVGVLCILCLVACAAAWRHFRPTRRTDTKHRPLSGRPATAQGVENRSHFTISLAAVAVILSGCASSPSEIAWQAMHLVDVAQTLNGPARDPCFEEGTSTRFLIGEKPSSEAVITWGVGLGVAHYAFDRWLHDTGRDAHPGWRLLRYVDLGYKGFTIGRNHAIGVRPFGDNHCSGRP